MSAVRKMLLVTLTAGLTVAAMACSGGSGTGPDAGTVLLDVVPAGGSSGVSVDTTITITFNHPMNPAMSQYASVHEGDVSGPVMQGTWSWSADTTALMFMPASALKPATTYTIHVGGGMMDADGQPVDLSQYGPGCGGQTATAGMMGGGMGSGGMGSDEMGAGWQGSDGNYGMVFAFTTAG